MSYTAQTYAGVADCHGIESFDLKSNLDTYDRSCRIMRAAANGQRYAVYYEADIEPEGVEVIKQYLKEKKYELALRALKSVAIEFSILPEHVDLLKKIPDPSLDPYA